MSYVFFIFLFVYSKSYVVLAELRAKRASGSPWVNQSTHPRKFGNHVTDRPTDRPSAPQAYQCLLSHFLATLGAQEKADCKSMLSSIDSCQNRVSESTSDVFNCLFPLDVKNEIQLLSRVFSYSWLVCLLGFWLRNASLVKADNPISDGIVFVFHLAGCVGEL